MTLVYNNGKIDKEKLYHNKKFKEVFKMTTKCRTYVDVLTQHSEVTGSSILVIAKMSNGEIVKGMIDCGIFQEMEYQNENTKFIIEPKNLNFVLITHDHIDHMGRLPLLVNKGFSKKIYCTNNTAALLPYTLHDNFKIMKDRCKRKNQKLWYNIEDVTNVEKLVVKKPYYETFRVHPKIKITFLENGHLLGASMVLVQIEDEENINLLFTGDYNNKNVFFEVRPIPQWIKELPISVITESTYGDRTTQEVLSEMDKTFEQNIVDAVVENKDVLIPSFALGRSQEILYYLKRIQEKNILDNYKLYLDGSLAIVYTELLKSGMVENLKYEMQDFLPKNFSYIVNSKMREDIINSRNRKIIITTSGMAQYGPAQIYIPQFLSQKNAIIHFTGYCAEGTYGRKLKEESQYNENIKFTTEFSAHAKKDVLLNLIKEFSDVKSILINHGSHDTKIKFKEYLEKEISKNSYILNKKIGYRVNAYGIMKELNTIF